MERPYTEDDARTAALDDRPTPRRNRRFRGRGKPGIPEFEPPSWARDRARPGKGGGEEATSALSREDYTRALPREPEPHGQDDHTRPLPREGEWRENYGPPRQLVLDRYRLERRIGA